MTYYTYDPSKIEITLNGRSILGLDDFYAGRQLSKNKVNLIKILNTSKNRVERRNNKPKNWKGDGAQYK